MGNDFLAVALDQLENRLVAGRVIAHLQTFAPQLSNNLMDRCRFM